MSRARPRNNRPTAISLPSQFDTSHGSKASTLVDVPSSAQERGADIVGKMVSERQTEKSNSSASESSDQETAVDDPSEEESLDPMLPAPSQLKLPSAKEVYDALPSQGTGISALISKVQGPIDRKHSKPFFPIVKAVTSFDNKRRWLTPLPQMPSKETIEKTINSTSPPKTVDERSEEEAGPCACTSPKQSPWVHNIKMLSVQAPEKNIGEMQNEACQLADKHSKLVQALDGLQSTKLSKIAEIFRERDEVIRNEIREANEFAEERIRRMNDHEQLLLGQLRDCFARERQVEASLLGTDPILFGMWVNEEASESQGGRRLRSDVGNTQAYMNNKRRRM